MLTIDNLEKDNQKMYISDDVVVTIIEHTIERMDSVVCLVTPEAEKTRPGAKPPENPNDVNVVFENDVIKIKVFVKVKESACAIDTAEKIQKSVKETVQAMTGKPVGRVDVTILSMM